MFYPWNIRLFGEQESERRCQMAQLMNQIRSSGETRYDVRTRIGGRVVTRTFKRKKDAVSYTMEVTKLRDMNRDA
jgi:hypothetical protein